MSFAQSPQAAGHPWKGLGAKSKTIDTVKVIITVFVAIVLTQKLAMPLGSSEQTQVALALLLYYGLVAYLLIHGKAYIDKKRAGFFAVIAGAAAIAASYNVSSGISMPALFLFLTVLAMYLFIIPLDEEQYRDLMDKFTLFAIFVGCAVWFNWATQMARLGQPSIETFVPKIFLYREYNYLKKMWWGFLQVQPNGFFFLESSHLSQFIAMALVVEAALFQRFKRMIFFALSLLASFGGTGLLICVACAPFLLIRLRPAIIVACVVSLPIVLGAAGALGVLDNISRRSSEVGGRNSSTTIRFQLPVDAVVDAATGPMDTFLLGKGPGLMPRGLNVVVSFAWAPYAKLMVEYGFIVFALWLPFLCYCIFRPGIPFVISLAAFVQFMFLNGALSVPLHTIYCLFLAGAYLIRPQQQGSTEKPQQPAG